MEKADDTVSVSTSTGQAARDAAGPSAETATHVGSFGPVGLVADGPEIPAAVGRFRVLDELGRGGMGVVMSAYDEALDRKVAIKVIRAERAGRLRARARMIREARAMARLSHPNVVHVYEVGELDDGRMYVAMEYVRGQTLTTWLAKRRPWSDVVAIFGQCGEGLLAAHRTGLVHRDFKPANAMLGEDGRVRVLDFGLARGQTSDSMDSSGAPPSSGESSPLPESDLTEAGVVMGTPAYMAPEQAGGGEVDARSDQFSFCLALYQGLYGARPERTGDLAQRLRDPPSGHAVPTWVHRAVVRGLAHDREARWPSMQELLDALRRDPSRRLVRAATGVGLGALTTLGVAAGLGLFEPDPPDEVAGVSCDGREALRGVWDDERRAAVRAAFVRLDSAYARQAAPLVVQRLDDYSERWAGLQAQTCEVRRQHDAADDLLDRRATCLRRRRVELAAFVDRLEEADAALLRTAARGAAELPSVQQCADVTLLAAAPEPPTNPDLAARVDAAGDELARAAADDRAGRYDDALARAQSVLVQATALGWLPLQAEAHYRIGVVLERSGRFSEASSSLLTGYMTAEAAEHAPIRAELATALTFVVGTRLSRAEEGSVWAADAKARLDALGARGELQSRLSTYVGTLEMERGDPEAAIEHYRHAIEILEAAGEGDHPQLIVTRLALGAALGGLGRTDEAKAEFERTLAVVEAAFGDLHPIAAAVLSNIGTITYRSGDLEGAAAAYERALAVYEVTVGEEHTDAATTLNNLGSLRARQGKFDVARRALARALAIRRAAYGDDHPSTAAVLNNQALLHERLGEFEPAHDLYRRAHAALEKHHGPDHPSLHSALSGLGVTSSALGRYEDAVGFFARAADLPAGNVLEEDVAVNEMAHARALWDAPVGAGRDRERALAMMRRALSRLDGPVHGTTIAPIRAAARAWLDVRAAEARIIGGPRRPFQR